MKRLLSLSLSLSIVCAITATLVLSGCKPVVPQSSSAPNALAPAKLAAGEKLQVVATTSIVAYIARNVGGDAIQITMLLPLGADPHTFQGSPRDVAALSDAHLILTNGAGLEEFLEPLIESAAPKGPVVALSDGITLRQLEQHEEHDEHEEGEEHEGEHHHEGADPHTWTTPANVIIFAQNAERALSVLDPTNAETYRANANAYVAQLQELDAWVKSQIETIPAENRKLVTDHMAYGYYADRYGLTQVGEVIPSFSTAAEPSAQAIADLEQAIKAQGVRAVFVGVGFNPTLVERIAADTGIQVATLYGGSLGPTGSGAETYMGYIRYNTTAIVDALK